MKLGTVVAVVLLVAAVVAGVMLYGNWREADALAKARRDSIMAAGEVLADSSAVWQARVAALDDSMRVLESRATGLRRRWRGAAAVADSASQALTRHLEEDDDIEPEALAAIEFTLAAKDSVIRECSVLVANCEERVGVLLEEVQVITQDRDAWQERAGGLDVAWQDAEARARRKWFERPVVPLAGAGLLVLVFTLMR